MAILIQKIYQKCRSKAASVPGPEAGGCNNSPATQASYQHFFGVKKTPRFKTPASMVAVEDIKAYAIMTTHKYVVQNMK